MTRTIEVPDDIWADFVNVLFAADRHVVRTEDNENVMGFIKGIIMQAFQEGSVLIVDGKIVPKSIH